MASADSCDRNWPEILPVFENVITLADFKAANRAAQCFYHSFLGEIVILPVQEIASPYEVSADEVICLNFDSEYKKESKIDLRKYKNLIKGLVSIENDKDPNWKWFVKDISKTRALIHWGYLYSLDEKETCFIVTAESDDCLGDTIVWRHPSGEMLSFAVIGETYYGVTTTIESALENAIKSIAYYAHSRY